MFGTLGTYGSKIGFIQQMVILLEKMLIDDQLQGVLYPKSLISSFGVMDLVNKTQWRLDLGS